MRAHSNERIAYLAAASMLFSAAELFIPKPMPFFRLGLANIPILVSLSLPLSDFLILLLLKAITSSYIAGNLFSPFIIMSLSQTMASGMTMRVLNRLSEKRISLYGISAGGAAASCIVQLAIASLYLGKAVLNYMPIMIGLSLISSALIAFISLRIDISNTPELKKDSLPSNSSSIFYILMLVLSSASVLAVQNVISAFITFILAIILQKSAHRKVMITPYASIIFFMLFTSLFAPEGRILWQLGPLRAGTISLHDALLKALRLASLASISQSFTNLLTLRKGILSMTIEYAAAMISCFNGEKGKLIERINRVLSLKNLNYNGKVQNQICTPLIIFFTFSFIAISCISFIIK